MATAAQTELLGNARFLKDVRFGDGARRYIFDDGKGCAVGAFWKFDEEMVRGRKTSGTIGLDFSGMDPEFFDMMANRVSVPVVGGKTCPAARIVSGLRRRTNLLCGKTGARIRLQWKKCPLTVELSVEVEGKICYLL